MFVPTRTWNIYASAECKGRANRQYRRREVPADLRATYRRIESKLDEIISALSVKTS
jgi:hypothetical protein